MNPFNAWTLVQFHDRQAIVVNPPALLISQAEMDRIYDLPHPPSAPGVRRSIPAYG